MTNATADQIMATLRQDVDQMEKSRMWPFSCYAVVKEMNGGISGFFDVSPEELRINYLLNRSNPAVHVESVNLLSQKLSETRQQARNPMSRDQLYQEYRNGGNPNPSQNGNIDLSWLNVPGQRMNNSSATTNNTSSPFGSSSGGFGSNPFNSSAAQSSPFGSSSGQRNPFSSTVQNTPPATNTTTSNEPFNPFKAKTTTGFGEPQQQQQQATFPTSSPLPAATNANPFQTQAANVNPFQAQPNQPVKQNTNSNPFGTALPVDQKDMASQQDDSVVYTPVENLTQIEIAAYQADRFTFDNLPINPPPKEACV